MSMEILYSSLTVGVAFFLSALLIFKWIRTKIKFYSDLPFLFGVSILFIGFSTLLNLLYSITAFIPELTLFRIRGILIYVTAFTMFTGVLKIWFPENYKLLIVCGLIYATGFLIILFTTPTVSLIVTYTSPFIAINIILVIITFSIVYLKKRLPSINSPLIILGALIILISQFIKALAPSIVIILPPDLVSLIGWAIFTLGFLIKAPYFRVSAEISLKSS